MNSKTRKHIWPMSLVMSIAIIGALAASLVLTSNPGVTGAHGGDQDPHCSTVPADRIAHDVAAEIAGTTNADGSAHTCDNPGTDDVVDPGNGNGNGPQPGAASVGGFSSSPSGKADIKVTITTGGTDGTGGLSIGSKVVVFLDDKFQVPDSFASGDVVFISYDSDSAGSPVSASVEVDDGDSEQLGEDAWAVIATLPNMGTEDDRAGIAVGQDLTLRIKKAAGIKSPTEAGDYKYGYQILKPVDTLDFDGVMGVAKQTVAAKVGLSDKNNKRGYELVVTGSGFNKDSSATAYVLKGQSSAPADGCATVIADGESIGSGSVGSDHNVAITAEVTGGSKGDFSPGETNYICIRDDNSPERRMSASAEAFDLQHSIDVSPDSVVSGEEVTIKLRDYPSGYVVTNVSLDGKKNSDEGDFDIDQDGSELTFEMPGGVSGTVEVAIVATGASNKTDTITVNPANLKLSETGVVPNEVIIISGSGFNENSYVLLDNITIDDEPLVVDDAGVERVSSSEAIESDDAGDDAVKTTSDGDFTATVNVWANGDNNPVLDDGEYTIKVKDAHGFEGKAKITIMEPTVSVNPKIASPRDYITISGENWPASNSDDDHEVRIEVDGKIRSANIDSTGRFNHQHQLSGGIDIGDEHDVVVTFDGAGGDIEEETTFAVPSSNVTITPPAAAPGEMISLEITGMPIYEGVDRVMIDGGNRLSGSAINTDSEGDVTIADVLVPYADPGFYPVRIDVGNETAVVQLEILAESDVRGVASPLPESVMDLGDSLVRIFHFNTSSKVWTFYDPRPEFEGLNTLTELAAGQPYWILVSETQENVVLNGRPRDLTCVGGDCWNQLVW